MKTFTINVTDITGRFWTMEWTPSTSKNKKLSDSDIEAVVHFIKTQNWPKVTSPAARNCFETLAAQIANVIIDDVSKSNDHSNAFIERLINRLNTNALSKKGEELLMRFVAIAMVEPESDENYNLMCNWLKKLVKTEKLFSVNFVENQA